MASLSSRQAEPESTGTGVKFSVSPIKNTLRKSSFVAPGMQGLFVQIRNAGDGVDYAWKSLAGQQRAACVKFLPAADGTLCFSVSEGKWLDKVVSGILSWAIFAPLIVVPAIGAWQQKKFLDEIERNLLVWFANWS